MEAEQKHLCDTLGKFGLNHIDPRTEEEFRYLFVLLTLSLQTEWC